MTTRPPLTRRERFCRLYDFQPVDRPVRWESVEFWYETVAEWKAAGTLPADANAMTYYGFEPQPKISGGLGFTWMSLSGAPVTSRVVEVGEGTRVVEDDLGARRRERTDGCSMPQFLRFPVESHADWLNKIKPRLDPAAHDYGPWEAEAAATRTGEDPWGFWLLGLYAFWRNFWGEEKLAFAFYDFPDTLHDMARTWLRMHLDCSPRILRQARFDYVLFHEDMAFKNGPLIGPHLFDAFMVPYYRELFAHLRAHGFTRFMLDSDGHNGPILDRFIDLGMNGLFPFEAAAGYDIREVRKRYPRFFIWGGIDKRVLNGSRDDIKREVMEKVPEVWASGGFIPSLDHSCQPCPQANFEYYLELVRGLF
jgi:uroporphyrinogen decarboxylase